MAGPSGHVLPTRRAPAGSPATAWPQPGGRPPAARPSWASGASRTAHLSTSITIDSNLACA